MANAHQEAAESASISRTDPTTWPFVMRPDEVAQVLGMHKRTVLKLNLPWANLGTGRERKCRGLLRNDLIDFIHRQRLTPPNPATCPATRRRPTKAAAVSGGGFLEVVAGRVA